MIKVFDDIFLFKERQYYYQFIKDSNYKIGWPDQSSIETLYELYFFSTYSSEDIQNLGILKDIGASNTPNAEELRGLIKGREPALAVVNCDQFSTVHWPHTDSKPHRDVLLYYVNLEWNTGWYGETLFYDEGGLEISSAVSYRPGRVAFFDGNHPHAVRPSSRVAPNFRFTLSIFFDNEDH